MKAYTITTVLETNHTTLQATMVGTQNDIEAWIKGSNAQTYKRLEMPHLDFWFDRAICNIPDVECAATARLEVTPGSQKMARVKRKDIRKLSVTVLQIDGDFHYCKIFT